MKTTLFILFCTIVCLLQTQYQQAQDIELVESIPVETTLDNPDIRNTQEVWLEMINSAQKTIDIEQFYISNKKGEPLDTVLNAIVAAAKRGVIVRIVVDGEMFRTYPDDVTWLEQQSTNITKHVIDFKSLAGGVQHAKFFIIDGKEVFIGSQNFDWRALKHIHELGVRINDENYAKYVERLFNIDLDFALTLDDSLWQRSEPGFIADRNDSIVILPTSSPRQSGARWDFMIISDIINFSKKEINLQFLSYNSFTKEDYWNELDSLLIKACKRGVKVKLIISDWNLNETAIRNFKELITHPNFEIKYTEIPEFSEGFIPFARVEHCKYVIGDTVCWIGSSNASKNYFYNSRNLGIAIYEPKFTQRLNQIFYKSWDSEYAVPIEPNGEYMPRKRDW